MNQWRHRIFSLSSQSFSELALDIYMYQSKENPIYASYIEALRMDTLEVMKLEDIPFMPIDFFKFHKVICAGQESDLEFSSSTTTSVIPSRHYVADRDVYSDSLRLGFKHFYKDIEDYDVLALLPSYLEREGSSLVYMVSEWNKLKGLKKENGFYLYDHEGLKTHLERNEEEEKKTLLIGVSFGLLDFAEKYQLNLKHTIVMETGGMKGRREELTREELHSMFKESFGVSEIHSEYGMTELLSQAYSTGGGIFKCPPWMKVIGREMNDPFTASSYGTHCALNIIDLANVHSCSFISTSDIGKVYEDGSFEVLGRMDVSDTRGCNLMVG